MAMLRFCLCCYALNRGKATVTSAGLQGELCFAQFDPSLRADRNNIHLTFRWAGPGGCGLLARRIVRLSLPTKAHEFINALYTGVASAARFVDPVTRL